MPHPALKRSAKQQIRFFGQPALYIKEDGESFEIKAIFQEHHADFDMNGVQASARQPTAWISTAVFGGADTRDQIEVEGKTYAITSVEPDGYGIEKLELGEPF